jgi:hypothetical protein
LGCHSKLLTSTRNLQRFKYMKKIFIPAFALLFAVSFSGCGGHRDEGNTNVTINANSDLSKGLDLVALGELLKKTKDAKTLEEDLNKEGSINNVDLDGDGKVDYLKVTEYGSGNERGLSITDEVKKGETQEIATIQIAKDNDKQASVNIQGNQDIYGPSASYHSSFGFTDFLLMSYLFAPHPYYYSPWGWGYYPGWYRPVVVVPYGAYRSRMQTVTSTSTIRRSATPYSSHITSPNAGKSSSTALSRSVNSPMHSQKSFGARDANKSVGHGGFGKSSKSSPSHGFGSGGSSHRSFGGGRGGFGGRRR